MGNTTTTAVALYWIPLGAGDSCVRFNGRVYEALVAARERRPRCSLYHSALVIDVDEERYTVEVAPSPDADEGSPGWSAPARSAAAISAGSGCFAMKCVAGRADRSRISHTPSRGRA